MARIHLSPPDVGEHEREALLRAFDSGWVAPAGPELDAFEADLADVLGWPGVVALSSGTAALHLALVAHGVGFDDEVFVSDLTFVATANAVSYVGAHPTFIDSDTTSWNMDPQLLADALSAGRKVNRLPAAVIVVDLYGQCADYDEIVPMCAELGVPVIEDAAEALGSTYRGRPAGTLGDSGVFSFNGNKIITTSGGGAFVTAEREVADRVRYLATQARQPVVHYEHRETGFNYRLSNLLAALGRAQLARLPSMSTRRREINGLYRSLLDDLDDLTFMPALDETDWNGWLTCILLEDGTARDRALEALEADGIESRPLWKPMHKQPVFEGRPRWGGNVAEDLFSRGLCLPSGSSLSDADAHRVATTVHLSVTTT